MGAFGSGGAAGQERSPIPVSKPGTITQDDVAKLLDEPSPETRAATAEKVGRSFAGEDLGETERALAQDIFRAMVKDAEVRVRRALADTLKASPGLPPDVARTLAGDVHAVALTVIEYSEVLTDADLIEIIRSEDVARQVAVARRRRISPDVADALVDTDNEEVVSTLVGNSGAEIREATYVRMLDRFGEAERVTSGMAARPGLPLTVAERLVALVSDSLRDRLIASYEIAPDTMRDLMSESRERATAGLLSPGMRKPDITELVAQMYEAGRLTPTMIIRALCMGDLVFFETALAKRAKIPAVNAHQLVNHKECKALERLFARAEMPSALLDLARIGIEVARETSKSGGDDRDQFRKVVIERVVTQADDAVDADNLDYLIGKLGKQAA